MAFGRRKDGTIRRPFRILFALMCLITAALVALNVAMFGLVFPHLDILQVFTSRPDMEKTSLVEASQATADITEEVESEGLILLTNNGALPLAGVDKVNVFGSTVGNNFSYGGTGSGSGDASKNVTFYQGLENAGLAVNPDLMSFYEANAVSSQDMGLVGTDWNLYELPQSDYDQALIDGAKSYSDVAIVVITRKGGEGFDLPTSMAGYTGSEDSRHYLELTPNEEDLLAMAKSNFGTVVVVLNSPNAMELGFLEDEAIDAALWVGTPGATGCNAIGKALTGGHITLAATVASSRVAETISCGSPSAFMHGPTYMANPLACAAGCASLDLFASSDYASNVARIERYLRASLEPLRALENVTDVRVKGAVGVLEMRRLPDRADIERVIDRHNVWLRPFANYIYTMPPLVTDDAALGRIVEAMADLAACPPGPEAADGDFHE